MSAIQIILTALAGFGFIITAGWLVIEIINLIEEEKYRKKLEKEINESQRPSA